MLKSLISLIILQLCCYSTPLTCTFKGKISQILNDGEYVNEVQYAKIGDSVTYVFIIDFNRIPDIKVKHKTVIKPFYETVSPMVVWQNFYCNLISGNKLPKSQSISDYSKEGHFITGVRPYTDISTNHYWPGNSWSIRLNNSKGTMSLNDGLTGVESSFKEYGSEGKKHCIVVNTGLRLVSIDQPTKIINPIVKKYNITTVKPNRIYDVSGRRIESFMFNRMLINKQLKTIRIR